MGIISVLSKVVFEIIYNVYCTFIFKGKKRRADLGEVAEKLGLEFSPFRDYKLYGKLTFLNKLNQGSNIYAYNIMRGKYKSYNVTIFDFHFEITNPRCHTDHLYTILLIELPGIWPELIIHKEDLSSKFAQSLGYEDIDFENYEFSKKYCVRSKNKKFAYDICNTQMIEFFLKNDNLYIEIENDIIMLFPGRYLKPDEFQSNLDKLVELRKLVPDYLFQSIVKNS